MAEDKYSELISFKTSDAQAMSLRDATASLETYLSPLLRRCIDLALPMVLQCPALMEIDRQAVTKLSDDIGKTLVIRPMQIVIGKKEEK